MKGLLYKEFTTAKEYIIFKLVLQILISATVIFIAMIGESGRDTVITASLCYFFSFTFTGIMDEVFFRNDEKRPWCNFATALPQTAKGQVACKYYIILIENLVLLCCCFFTDLFVIAIVGNITVSAMVATMVIFCWQLIISAIDIPFMVRFGSTSGTVVKGMVLVGIVVVFGIYLLFGDISFLFEGNTTDKIMMFFKSPNVIWIVALIPYVTLGVYYLSYRISLKLYQKGAENYEQ